MALANKVIYQNGAIREFEKPEVCKAIKVANANKWVVGLSLTEWDERKARLKKEYEENTKATGSGGDQPKEGNPALAESASQFNDALLDEQAKKIAELTEEKERLEDKITIFNIFKKRNDEAYRRQIRSLDKEISKLNGIIHDKNAVLSDVAEELRLSKIREKNMTEVCQKYMKENEELKKELADKVVDKIDAQALKSAESALAWKEKVIARKDMALAYDEKKIAEKDEEVADLVNELEATKKELEAFKESYKRRIKEDSEHFEHIQKICNAGLQKWLIESEYLEKDKPFRFPQLPDFSEEELMKLHEKVCVDIAEEGKDHSSKVVLCGKDVVKKFKEKEESLSEFFKNIEDEAVESTSIESGHLGGNESFGQMEAVKPSQMFKQAVCDARL